MISTGYSAVFHELFFRRNNRPPKTKSVVRREDRLARQEHVRARVRRKLWGQALAQLCSRLFRKVWSELASRWFFRFHLFDRFLFGFGIFGFRWIPPARLFITHSRKKQDLSFLREWGMPILRERECLIFLTCAIRRFCSYLDLRFSVYVRSIRSSWSTQPMTCGARAGSMLRRLDADWLLFASISI